MKLTRLTLSNAHTPRWILGAALTMQMASTQCTPPRPTVVAINNGNNGGNGTIQTIVQRPPVIVDGFADAGVTTTTNPGPGGTLQVTADGDFLPRIDNEVAWNALAARRERDNTAHTDTVKIVIDLSDGQIYFLQTRRWEIHYFFIRRFLARPGLPIPDAETFWRREYLSNDRRFVQASLVRYRDQNVWAFELIAQDVYDPERSVAAFTRVRERLYFGSELKFHPIATQHVAAIDSIRARVPVVTTDDLFANTRYQPLNTGDAYGYLRFHTGTLSPANVRRNDIVVLADVPLDLPVCAGVITSQLQTPLSHIAILSANRGTPNMALRNAISEGTLRAWEGRLVHLHVGGQDFTVEAATQAQAEQSWARGRPATDTHPARTLDDRGLRALNELQLGDVNFAGAKASQLGVVARVQAPGFRVPPGFVIPFHSYNQHLVRNRLDAELRGYFANAEFNSNPTAREAALRIFKQHIMAAPVDPALLRAVRTRIGQLISPTTRIRLRSSTNAEDLEGFNGAGLYSSTVVPANFTDEQLATAIREVWASVWNYQAFEERAYYRIVQQEVTMAILVQQSVDGAAATGVAITGNPFDANRPGHFINTQLRDEGVTSASSGEIPEQSLFYTYPPPGFVERLSGSSRARGATVMSDREIRTLADALTLVHRVFIPDPNWLNGRAMDVEFLVTPSREVWIVQARPFRIVWDAGRQYSNDPDGV